MDVEQTDKLVGSSELQRLKRAVRLAYALIGVLFLCALALLIALAVVGANQGNDIKHLQGDYNVAPNVSFR
jgi:lipopolysaccharide/colanic/teichoic acid biosynthesis glycosyltransferase